MNSLSLMQTKTYNCNKACYNSKIHSHNILLHTHTKKKNYYPHIMFSLDPLTLTMSLKIHLQNYFISNKKQYKQFKLPQTGL